MYLLCIAYELRKRSRGRLDDSHSKGHGFDGWTRNKHLKLKNLARLIPCLAKILYVYNFFPYIFIIKYIFTTITPICNSSNTKDVLLHSHHILKL